MLDLQRLVAFWTNLVQFVLLKNSFFSFIQHSYVFLIEPENKQLPGFFSRLFNAIGFFGRKSQDNIAIGSSGGQSPSSKAIGYSGGQSQGIKAVGYSGGLSQGNETIGYSGGQSQNDNSTGHSGRLTQGSKYYAKLAFGTMIALSVAGVLLSSAHKLAQHFRANATGDQSVWNMTTATFDQDSFVSQVSLSTVGLPILIAVVIVLLVACGIAFAVWWWRAKRSNQQNSASESTQNSSMA